MGKGRGRVYNRVCVDVRTVSSRTYWLVKKANNNLQIYKVNLIAQYKGFFDGQGKG